jgi:TorA maturation chaperone TorD
MMRPPGKRTVFHEFLLLDETARLPRIPVTSYSEWNIEHAEAYRVLGQFFLSPPDEDALEAIRQDFGLDFQESPEELTEEFNRLFPYPHGMLLPLESLFTPADAIGRQDVERMYAGANLAIDGSYGVTPDHLTVEFLFMSYLIEKGDTEREKKFLEQHLMNWVPYYCDEVIKQTKTLFYRQIAAMVKDFLEAEYEEYAR